MIRFYLLVLLIAIIPARADTLALCVDANVWAPYTYPNHDGTLQILVKMAAAQLHQSVSIVALPWVRCQKSVESGALQGMVATSDTEYALRTFALPRLSDASGSVDIGRAMASGTIVLLRRVGSQVQWDGKHLSGYRGSVLYVYGYSDIARYLSAAGADVDGTAHGNEQNARKILAGRADVMAIYLNDSLKLMSRPEFAGRLEQMPLSLGDSNYYLAFNAQYYATNHDLIERLWNEIRTERHSDAYRSMIERAGSRLSD